MRVDDWREYEHFVLGAKHTLWSDIERARQIRKAIALAISRLEFLRASPGKNAEHIQREEILLERARHELDKLERHLLIA